MKEKCKVVLLGTRNKTDLQVGVNYFGTSPGIMRGEYLYLYLCSYSQELKIGDLAYIKEDRYSPYTIQVIEDEYMLSLVCEEYENVKKGLKVVATNDPTYSNLLPIPQEFVKECIKQEHIPNDVHIIFNENNTIKVIPNKTIWTKQEVINYKNLE